MTSPILTAVFLDRDGTIIHDAHYLSRPEQLRLLDGAAEAIVKFNRVGVPVILVTNQSGIGRGYFTIADYERVHAHLIAKLAEYGAHLDGAYYCPHAPDLTPPCDCRKPGSLLFRQAMQEHRLDPSGAVALGDRWRDLAPVIGLGGTGILIPSPDTPVEDVARAEREASVAQTLGAATTRLLDAGDLLRPPEVPSPIPPVVFPPLDR